MIIVTTHAENRIKERTKLSLEDVKNILEAEAYCYLGQNKDKEQEVYYLFFSQPDSRCFVSVLTSDSTFLKTVLDPKQHSIPFKIKRKFQKEASLKYRKWFFARHVTLPEERILSDRMPNEETPVMAMLEVYVLEKKVFSSQFGEVLLSNYPSITELIGQHLDLFMLLAKLVDGWLPEKAKGVTVKYKFCVKQVRKAGFATRHTLRHDTLVKYLNKHEVHN